MGVVVGVGAFVVVGGVSVTVVVCRIVDVALVTGVVVDDG